MTSTPYSLDGDTQVLLKDGSSIRLRPILPEDSESCLSLVQKATEASKFLRFGHSPEPMGTESNRWFCTVDYETTYAVIAEMLSDSIKNIVAVGRYYR